MSVRAVSMAVFLGLLPFAAAGEEPAHEWPLFRGNAGFTGVSPDRTIKPPFKLVWEFRTDADGSGDASSGVLVAGGKVFAQAWSNETVMAVDARTGNYLWEAEVAGLCGRTSIAYGDGMVFVLKVRTNVMVALDAQTGKEIWNVALKGKCGFLSGRFRTGIAVWEGKVFGVEHGPEPAVVALDTRTGKEIWRAPLDARHGQDTIPPCVAAGKVFAGLCDAGSRDSLGATFALDAGSGKEIWRREGIHPYVSPSSDGKVVAVPMASKNVDKLYLLDAETGKEVWADNKSRTTPTIAEDMVLTKYYGNNFVAMDGTTGKELWKFFPRNTGCNTPVVAGDYVYFGSGCPQYFRPEKGEEPGKAVGGGKGFCNWYGPAREAGYGWTFYAIERKTGKDVWSFPTAFNVCGETAIAYGRLYQISGGGHIYCFEPAKEGEPATPEAIDKSPNASPEEVKKLLNGAAALGDGWPMAGGSPERNGKANLTLRLPLAAAWAFKTGGRMVCEPAIAGGKVFIGSDDGSIYAIDGVTGKAAWEKKTGARARCAPAVAGGVVYAGSDDGFLYALEAATGSEKWRFACGGPVRGAPAVAGGVVFFGANDHNVYALDRATGKKLWSFRTQYYRHHAAPVVHGDTVYILPGIDYVHALDAVTGQEKWKSFCCKTGEALVYYRDRLWARGWCLAELDAASGKVTRFAGQNPYGYNRPAFMGKTMFLAGNGRGAAFDLDAPGTQTPLGTMTAHRIGFAKVAGVGRYASPASSPLVLGDALCSVTKKGQALLAGADGKILWSADLGSTCHASPAAGCGLLAVGCDDGVVRAFREEGKGEQE